jgi:inorganic pyrophosphatase
MTSSGPNCRNSSNDRGDSKGSGNKYEYDGALGVFRLDRNCIRRCITLATTDSFGTLADDGDRTCWRWSRSRVLRVSDRIRPVGILNMVDNRRRTRRSSLCRTGTRYDEVHTMDQIFPHVRRELEHFF